MNRRAFLCGLTLGTVAAPLAAEAQQAGKTARVGNLTVGPQPSPGEIARRSATSPLLTALKELGWVEGQNMTFERRYGESAEQVKAAAADLVRLKVDVVIAWSTSLARLLQMETNTIPIVVIGAGVDLVAAGLVTSLARPGGNLTGLQILSDDLEALRASSSAGTEFDSRRASAGQRHGLGCPRSGCSLPATGHGFSWNLPDGTASRHRAPFRGLTDYVPGHG